MMYGAGMHIITRLASPHMYSLQGRQNKVGCTGYVMHEVLLNCITDSA